MSNSNYSIDLQRLKPVHTAYCGLHNLAENWSWVRDVNGRDRDDTETSCFLLSSSLLQRWPYYDYDTSLATLVHLETETSRPRPQPWTSDRKVACVQHNPGSWYNETSTVSRRTAVAVVYRDKSGARGGSLPQFPSPAVAIFCSTFVAFSGLAHAILNFGQLYVLYSKFSGKVWAAPF